MNRYLADLHIHTLLSPCGSLEMSPGEIIRRAALAGLDVIAVCDHNTTLQTAAVQSVGKRHGVKVFHGIELTTREEAHCVAILPDAESAQALQEWVDANIVKIPNVPEKFGDQVWVDERENIVGEIGWYLNSPIDRSIEEIAVKVKEAGGLFVPAHVDRQANSLIGQLGFIPPTLPVDAVEYNFPDRIAVMRAKGHGYLANHTLYTASDAHYPHLIGTNPSWLYAESRTFDELRKAFARRDGRRIVSRAQEP